MTTPSEAVEIYCVKCRAKTASKLDFTHFERCKRERLQLSGPRWSGVPGHRRLRQTVKNLRR